MILLSASSAHCYRYLSPCSILSADLEIQPYLWKSFGFYAFAQCDKTRLPGCGRVQSTGVKNGGRGS